jgi:hypothetical protein
MPLTRCVYKMLIKILMTFSNEFDSPIMSNTHAHTVCTRARDLQENDND